MIRLCTKSIICKRASAEISARWLTSESTRTAKTDAITTKTSFIDRNEVKFVHRTKHMKTSIVSFYDPKTLNSLTPELMRKILEYVLDRDKTEVLILRTDLYKNKKVFSSGGNLKEGIYQILSKRSDNSSEIYKSIEYMKSVCSNICSLATYGNKILVALMDGLAVGGGLGICAHLPIRIATENTICYLPEASICYHLDAGMSFFLPRLDEGFGYFLGLTCEKLNGKEAYLAGIATHYVKSSKIPAIIEDISSTNYSLSSISSVIDNYAEEILPDEWSNWRFGGDIIPAMYRCFTNKTTLDSIITHLEIEIMNPNNKVKEWAIETRKKLKSLCPFSLELCLASLNNSTKKDILSAFNCEHAITAALLRINHTRNALLNTIESVLINKDGVKQSDYDMLTKLGPNTVKNILSQTQNESELLPITDTHFPHSFFEYPHIYFSGMPTVQNIRQLILSSGTNKACDIFSNKHNTALKLCKLWMNLRQKIIDNIVLQGHYITKEKLIPSPAIKIGMQDKIYNTLNLFENNPTYFSRGLDKS